MRILYLIGNGFDVNLDLNTRFTDFYKIYTKSKSDNLEIEKVKKEINSKNWSDLELALGEYTSKIKSTKTFYEIFVDIQDNLAEYLRNEEKKIESYKIDANKLKENLTYPERSLLKKEENEIIQYKNNWSKNNWYVNVITFNYTQTFEKLIGEAINIVIENRNDSRTFYQGIKHIHGYIDKDMVLGVNDNSQISNKDFHNEPIIRNSFVKSNCNSVMKHTIDEQCAKEIKKADLICIFGSSIGNTDKIWWEKIGNHLKGGCNLIIFGYSSQNLSERRSFEKEIIREQIKKDFLDKTLLKEEEKVSIENQIYVGLNTSQFKSILQK